VHGLIPDLEKEAGEAGILSPDDRSDNGP